MLSKLSDFSHLEKNPIGILEPKKEHIAPFDISDVDIVVVPGIVFDMYGHRIGFGNGGYDLLLNDSKALKVGLAFSFQIFDRVPAEAHDVPVDIIVTEKEIIRCKR